jgi:hypothetical protein
MDHAFTYPANMRTHTVTRRQVFVVSLSMMLPALGLLILLMLVIFLGVLMYDNGPDIFNYPGYILESLGIYLGGAAWMPPAFALFATLLIRRRLYLQKVLDMPVLYGFDENHIYFNCAAFESAIRWECFNAWREKRDFFLLHDGTRWIMLPKAVWSETERKTIRGYLRRYATPASLTVQS